MDCLHHEAHDMSIKRNSKDIQDMFKLIEKNQISIGKNQSQIIKMVAGMTSLGLLGNYLIQTFGG